MRGHGGDEDSREPQFVEREERYVRCTLGLISSHPLFLRPWAIKGKIFYLSTSYTICLRHGLEFMDSTGGPLFKTRKQGSGSRVAESVHGQVVFVFKEDQESGMLLRNGLSGVLR